jgi:hypothetical protein
MNIRCDACHVYPAPYLGALCADCEAEAYPAQPLSNVRILWLDEEAEWMRQNFTRLEREAREAYWMGV